MKFRSLLTAICVLAAAQIVSAAPYAYIANSGNKTVSVIDTATNGITATVTLPDDNGATLPDPYAYSVTVGASGQYVYVGLQDTNEVVVIDAATSAVVKRITLQTDKPGGLAVNAAETRLYVAVNNSNTLRVIDISGTGASEVGRVNVDDSALSNPEGLVINPAGDKAYVANSTTNKIAVITLDEEYNNYIRSSVIDLGAGAYPMGLSISSDGTKLYFASMNGNAGIINTSTQAVTPMATDLGNLSVAVNPVSGNVYAPSNAMDLLYAFNSAGAALGSYASAAGPWGSSVTPSGAKLLVAMNLSNNVKVYDTANLATAPTAITLPAGAKPTSLGNFIGPAWNYTIAASATPPCTITPSGTVPVNYKGWTFGISGSGCEVTVNGSPVGMVSSYKISNVVDNSRTISVSQPVPGTYYPITCDWITSVGGYLVSTPAGISQQTKGQPVQFQSGTSPSINAANGFKAINWTGDCAGTADGQACVFNNLSAAKTCGATVVVAPIGGSIFDGSNYYLTWAACTAGAANYASVKLSTDITALTTDGPGYWYTLSNQWNKNDFTVKSTYTPMTLTITSVGIIANDLTL